MGAFNYAHLPAYKAHHLNVMACYDIHIEAAHKTAQEHSVSTEYAELDQLPADERIEIVDIAVQPWAQLEIAVKALEQAKICCVKNRRDSSD
ncbi:MAG: Gfo/Idh/MocA family oxidoreductase [Chloroflexi bacterium]|nr:Gfo/Idh/MocA family oxidoreductase [Chloroflexota bacterium]MCL5275251.1 Gfo/Idh/MocA family oxidoreductase [Chloroflexota bacterium]